VHMLAWHPGQNFLRLRIESLLYEEDYCYDFRMQKHNSCQSLKRYLMSSENMAVGEDMEILTMMKIPRRMMKHTPHYDLISFMRA